MVESKVGVEVYLNVSAVIFNQVVSGLTHCPLKASLCSTQDMHADDAYPKATYEAVRTDGKQMKINEPLGCRGSRKIYNVILGGPVERWPQRNNEKKHLGNEAEIWALRSDKSGPCRTELTRPWSVEATQPFCYNRTITGYCRAFHDSHVLPPKKHIFHPWWLIHHKIVADSKSPWFPSGTRAIDTQTSDLQQEPNTHRKTQLGWM